MPAPPLLGVPHTPTPAQVQGYGTQQFHQQQVIWSANFDRDSLAQTFPFQVGSTASLDTAQSHSGKTALKITKTGSANASIRVAAGSLTLIGRFWFYFTANPSGTVTMHQVNASVNSVCNFSAAGAVACGFSGATTASATGQALNTWHSVDYKIDMRGSTYTFDWMLDGVAQTQSTAAAAAGGGATQIAFDKTGAVTINYWIDDWRQSESLNDYPLADAQQQVMFDAATQGGGLTFTHTCTGANRYLTVGVALAGTTVSVSGITYAGAAMTKINRAVGNLGTELWGLINPALGANSVAITLSGATGSAEGAVSFTNADQTTQNGASGGASGSADPKTSAALTGPQNGMLVDAVGDGTITINIGTQAWNDGGGDGQAYLQTDGTAQSTVWTGGTFDWAIAAGVILPVGVTAPSGGTAYTDSGTIPLTIVLSGADALASVDAGTIPLTLTLSGADAVASTDAGTIPLTITLSGADAMSSTDAGTIPLTLVLSGADALASVDSGTIPLTIALSGADAVASSDSGTIPLTLVLSGADAVASIDAGTIPLTITMIGVEQFGPAPVGQGFDDLRDVRSPKSLPIP